MRIALLLVIFKNRDDESAHITITSIEIGLKKKGQDVCIISGYNKEFPKKEIFKVIKIYRGPNLGFKILNIFISSLLQLRKIESKKENFDIVHSFSSSEIISTKLRIMWKNKTYFCA